jgi:hypothetical protein
MSDDMEIGTTKWHTRMIPGGIQCSTRRRFEQGTGIVEDIVLEAGPLQLERRERELVLRR